ncbi:MAG: HDOD domain-containing protein [Candidatus Hydrogenedentes bacterium]|nr:HDOD domain-containing protein [Candidatus Hydrogenedentota bacterium]
MSGSDRQNPAGDLAGRPRDKRVGELLIEEGLISDEQLKQALEVQMQKGGKLFEVLIAQNTLTKDQLHAFLSRQSGVPAIDLRNYEIPRELVPIVPADFAREHVVLPIDKLGKLLTVGMACPLDTVTIQELQRITGLRVKAMLCKLDDIQDRIRRYYPIRDTVQAPPAPPKKAAPPPPPAPAPATPPRPPTTRRIPPRRDAIDKIAQTRHLPATPVLVQQIVRASEDPLKNVRDVAVLAAGDPAISTKLISIANAAAYGMAGSVSNVYLAAAVLGVNGIRTAVSEINASIPVACPAFNFKTFLVRSVFCATAAADAVQKSGRAHPADAYTAALIHDTGRLALAHIMGEDYGKVDSGLSVLDLMDGELEAFGFTHAEAGYRLALAWGLPPILAEAIRTHHDIDALKLDPLAATVALCAILAEHFERSTPVRPEAFQKAAGILKQSGLDVPSAIAIYDSTAAAIPSAPKSEIRIPVTRPRP